MSDLPNSTDENLVKGFQMKLYRATIFATPIIFGAMLIVLLCLLHIKRRRGMSDRTHRQGLMQLQVFTGTQLNHEEGLSKSFREKLPVVLYDNKTSSSFQVSQCAVCLSDYQVDEKIKQLPACNHSFHVHCIDEWLAKNVTCPICRTALTKEEVYNAMELWSTRDGERILWEERVINGAPNQGSLTTVDLSNNSSTRGTPSNEVTVDMDRI